MSAIAHCFDANTALQLPIRPNSNNPYGDFETIPVILSQNKETIASVKLRNLNSHQAQNNRFIFESALQKVCINSNKENENAKGDTLQSSKSEASIFEPSHIENHSIIDELKFTSNVSLPSSSSSGKSRRSKNGKTSVSLKQDLDSNSELISASDVEIKEIERVNVSLKFGSDYDDLKISSSKDDTIEKIDKLNLQVESFLFDTELNAIVDESLLEKDSNEMNAEDTYLGCRQIEEKIESDANNPVTENDESHFNIIPQNSIADQNGIFGDISFNDSELSVYGVSGNKFCRNNIYPNTNIKRFPVADDKVDFNVPYEKYNSIYFPFFDISMKKRRKNSNDSVSVMHRNPKGRTGMIGKGVFSAYGPNKYAFAVITKYKRSEKTGEIERNKKSNKPLLHVLVSQRDDYLSTWALPGGSRDSDLFFRQIISDLQNARIFEILLELSEKLFNEPSLVYDDYLDDYFNTDNAWLHAIVEHYHHGNDEVPMKLDKSLDDSFINPEKIKMKWLDIDDYDIYEPHKIILELVAKSLDAHYAIS
jgi:ADP-ribose pyrophosphatase